MLRPRVVRRARALSERLESRTLLATFVVTGVADSGPGSLRQAILDADALPGTDTITFNIGGDGAVRTIRPLSPLPEVTGQTTIDGRTQPGAAIELDGSLAGPGASGLVVTASNSIVRGLVINRFDRDGISVAPAQSGATPGPVPTGIRVEGNLIGTDWTGNVALGNGGAGVFNSGIDTVIGVQNTATATNAARNVISGNAGPGVWAVRSSFINGDYIGTSVSGSRAVPNGRDGVLIEGATATIGGTTAATRNVISGNGGSGIRVAAGAAEVDIRNSYIGTDATGAVALPNGWSAPQPYHDGITMQSGYVFLFVPSAATQGLRNVISGNIGAGIRVEQASDSQISGSYIGTDATGSFALGNGAGGVVVSPTDPRRGTGVARLNGNVISANHGDGVFFGSRSGVALTFGGNYIGTNAAGTAALGNTGNGVFVAAGVHIPSIGDVQTGRNLISANGGHGIVALGSGVQAIATNYIGTDITGTRPLGNGGSGIYTTARSMTIGGFNSTSFSGGNLISANGGNGITLALPPGTSRTPANNLVAGNRIGTAVPAVDTRAGRLDPGADTGMGNHGHGIAVMYSAGNRIGTGERERGNVIAYNNGSGVFVRGGTVQTLITANGIYGNGKLGIDLWSGGEGVTPNDPLDADTGPNGLQNYPTITQAVISGTVARIDYVLSSQPNRTYRVEFFASPLPDPSGYGEGATFVGVTTVTTGADGSGQGSLEAMNVPTGSAYFTATAIADNSVTSEFSPAVQAVPSPTPYTFVRARQSIPRGSVYGTNGFTAGQALLPGQLPTVANVSHYTGGINDVRVFLAGLEPGSPLSADDFEFHVGTGAAGDWRPAPAPLAVTPIPDPASGGPPDAVYDVTWPDGAIRNTWLRVTVKANERTRLAAPDVFYIGSLIGDRGESDTLMQVTADDVNFARTEIANHNYDGSVDFNLDFVIDAQDVAAATANLGRSLGFVVNPPPTPVTAQASNPQKDPITAQVLA